jgi:hypothetical protein
LLDAFIIEEIKRREREQEDRPRLDLPLPDPSRQPSNDKASEEEDKPQRGVIIIDYSIPAA